MADDWTREFYETPLAASILTRDPVAIDSIADRLAHWLRLGPGGRVFDQCCGDGSISRALAGRGHPVHGVDISAPFVEAALNQARDARLDATYARGDACTWVTETLCDGGFNWGTGFGCSAHDSDNQAMLQAAADSLRPGARFVLDYYNVAGVLADFKPSFTYERTLSDKVVQIQRRSELDLPQGLLHQAWSCTQDGRRVEMPRTTTRLYLPKEVALMLEHAGFEVLECFGDHEGGRLALTGPRCLFVAQKQG